MRGSPLYTRYSTWPYYTIPTANEQPPPKKTNKKTKLSCFPFLPFSLCSTWLLLAAVVTVTLHSATHSGCGRADMGTYIHTHAHYPSHLLCCCAPPALLSCASQRTNICLLTRLFGLALLSCCRAAHAGSENAETLVEQDEALGTKAHAGFLNLDRTLKRWVGGRPATQAGLAADLAEELNGPGAHSSWLPTI